MKKYTWLIAALVVVVFTANWLLQSVGTSIKIGIVGPFTGNQVTYGIGVKEGIDLAFSELKNKTVNGWKVELVYEDTGGEVKNAVSAARKLIDIDEVAALSSAGPSQEAVALAPVAEKARTPLYTVISQASELTDAGDYVFRTRNRFS